MNYITHPLLKKNKIEKRTYQEIMIAQAINKNLMCVLPTGLGKTAIAAVLAAYRIEKFPESKILMLAPTKPLVEQHKNFFEQTLNFEKDSFCVLTGKIPPKKRKSFWDTGKLFFATPQVVENDLISGILNLKDFSLVVFDECHRAVKDYAYVFIAQKYVKTAKNQRILALTASPGGNKEIINSVAKNLFINAFEIRSDEDSDVKKYIQSKEILWIHVPLSRNFERIKLNLEKAYKSNLKKLKNLGIITSILGLKKKDLLRLRGSISSRLSRENDPRLYSAISLVAGTIKLQYALELLQTQGIFPFYKYMEKLRKEHSKAARNILSLPEIQNVYAITEWMYKNGMEHPKLEKLIEILKKFNGKCIVFTQYRNTVDLIYDRLKDLQNLKPVKFKGQKEGFTQKKQLEILDKFRSGEFNVLISTSVGEEGLDIPDVDLVIFYEPIPSEIRSIQRRGRTARQRRGKIYVLITENTIDEAYFWSSFYRERKMKNTLKNLKNSSLNMVEKKQHSLDSFVNHNKDKIVIYCDDRERKIIKELSNKDVLVRPVRLDVADFIVSDRVAVERKSSSDFVNSIIDQRLFTQLKNMKDQFELPILIIEGKFFYERNIHPNAIWGALSSIALDYKIPVMWSSDINETAEILISLAKREQLDLKKSFSIRGEKKPKSVSELQKFIVVGLPNVNSLLAKRLLSHFGSVRNIFNASETELKKIKGLGSEKSKRIYDIINREYNEKEN